MAPAVDDVFGLVGYQLDGKYTVEAVVARGGFGVVYRAFHEALQTRFAVKVLRVPDDLTESARGRFLDQFVDEARIVARLQHPAVVRVTDFGVSTMPNDAQAPWMVLEWIDGTTLAADLAARRCGPGRPPAEALALLRPVIDGIAAAHELGIAHRDIKPGNVMLTLDRKRAGASPTARVLDFGIAKIMGEDEDRPASGHTNTASATSAFSLRYASPEQISRTRTGPWTDVHALGLILTELLTDQPPYPVNDKLEINARILGATRPTPAVFGVDAGPWEAVIARAVALRPADRYPDAGALLAALEAQVPAAAHFVPRAVVAVESALPERTLTPTERVVPPPRPARLGLAGAALAALGAAAVAGVVTLGPRAAPRSRPPVAAPAAPPASLPAAPPPTPPAPAPAPAVAAPVAPSPEPIAAATVRPARRASRRAHHRQRLRPE